MVDLLELDLLEAVLDKLELALVQRTHLPGEGMRYDPFQPFGILSDVGFHLRLVCRLCFRRHVLACFTEPVHQLILLHRLGSEYHKFVLFLFDFVVVHEVDGVAVLPALEAVDHHLKGVLDLQSA